MIVSAAGSVKSRKSAFMGQYNFYQMGSNGRPIYKNSKDFEKYIYFDADGDWAVSYELSMFCD